MHRLSQLKIPKEELQRRWNGGESFTSLAKACGMSRKTLTLSIVPRLRNHGLGFDHRNQNLQTFRDRIEQSAPTRNVPGDPYRARRLLVMAHRADQQLPIATLDLDHATLSWTG